MQRIPLRIEKNALRIQNAGHWVLSEIKLLAGGVDFALAPAAAGEIGNGNGSAAHGDGFLAQSGDGHPCSSIVNVDRRLGLVLNAFNKRAEMHLDLQDLIETKTVSFTSEAYEAVKDILPFVTRERKSNNKIKINEKSEIKAQIGRSPDELDAVLLSIHAMYVFMGEGLNFD